MTEHRFQLKVAKIGGSTLERNMGFLVMVRHQRAWQDWVDQNRETLITCSLTGFVYHDRLTFLRFLSMAGGITSPVGVSGCSPRSRREPSMTSSRASTAPTSIVRC